MTPQLVVVEASPVVEASVREEATTGGSSCQPWGEERKTGTVRWSADGTAIFFGLDSSFLPVGGGYHRQLVEILGVAADGSRMWRVGQVAQRESVAATFDIAPNDRHIVYATCQFPAASDKFGNRLKLALTTIQGSSRQRLTATGTTTEHNPAWSPDGAHIAYVVGNERNTLSLMRADGANSRALGGGFDFVARQPPAWSPDGRWLAVTGVSDWQERLAARREGRESGPEGMWVLHLVAMPTGKEFIRLSDAVSGASWSPDGERLAFAKVDGDEVALYTIAADGSDARRLTTIAGWHELATSQNWYPNRGWNETVAWSPDGSKILYTCGVDLCVVDVDGNLVGRSPARHENVAPLPTPWSDDEPKAAWSPNSTQIAVIRPGGQLYTMDPNGNILRILVTSDMSGRPQAIGPRRAEGPVDVTGCAGGTVVPDPAANPGLVGDCETLLRLQPSLAGGAPLPWTGKRPLTTWDGVVVAGSPARVTAISLSRDVLLRGIIPPELGKLTHLQVLELNRHKLGGTIPPELGQLTDLQVLRLDRNRLSGAIPAELGELTGLTGLWLNSNYLHGPIPAELSRLANLESLNLGYNFLTGPIPPELGQLANLFVLRLSVNGLTGAIPGELGQLANLGLLDLGFNHLTGAIPPELGQLANLITLQLPNNELTGAIPAELGQLANLQSLDLGGNRLTGAIPGELDQLANLLYPDLLGGNQFTGCTPPAVHKLLSRASGGDLPPVCDNK